MNSNNDSNRPRSGRPSSGSSRGGNGAKRSGVGFEKGASRGNFSKGPGRGSSGGSLRGSDRGPSSAPRGDSFRGSDRGPRSAPRGDSFRGSDRGPSSAPRGNSFRSSDHGPRSAPSGDSFRGSDRGPSTAPRGGSFRSSDREAGKAPRGDSFRGATRGPSRFNRDDTSRFSKQYNEEAPKKERSESLKGPYKYYEAEGKGSERREKREYGSLNREKDTSIFSEQEDLLTNSIDMDNQNNYSGTESEDDGFSKEDSNDRLEGKNPVLEAFRAGRTINKLWIIAQDSKKQDPIIAKIISMAKMAQTPVLEVPKTTLDRMATTNAHQGVIAQTASHEYVEIDSIIEAAKEKGEEPLLIALDGLKDSYNLGSVLRIADAAGVHGVIIPKHRSIGLDAMVAKASAGAIEHVPVARVNNLSRTLIELKEKGFWVYGADAGGQTTYDKADYKGSAVIVIGSEGEGISANISDKCDVLVTIPMSGEVNSLNAAVATGIIVFEAQNNRRK